MSSNDRISGGATLHLPDLTPTISAGLSGDSEQMLSDHDGQDIGVGVNCFYIFSVIFK
jgi:hypothetical protein